MDLTLVRKLAGLLTEARNDDDETDETEMSAAERELIAKTERDLKKAGVDIEKAEKAEKAKKAEKNDTDKETDKKVAAEQATTSKKMHQARAWLKDNKTATRKEFMNKAADWGMSPKFANVAYYKLKKQLTEAWILQHPLVDRFVLAENKTYNRFQWVSLDDKDGIEPIVVGSKEEAEKIETFLRTHKGQIANVTKVDDE